MIGSGVNMPNYSSLLETIREGERLVIFLHDNPDPDSVAAGMILQRIGEHAGVRTQIVFGGRPGGASTRTMVKLLKIPMRSLDGKGIRYLMSDRYALVDTQPGAGNNSFPDKHLRCHIVIDHHPKRTPFEADFVDIRPKMGSSTTILLAYHKACGLKPDPDLATAAAYAILSETQDLERETTRADREAFLRLFPLVKLRALGKIRHPVHEREYYRTIARAMRRVMVSKNTCVCHIGKVHSPELVAEVADFLVAMEKVTWCLVSGYHARQMALSIRTRRPHARAEQVMLKVLGGEGKGGGHDFIAGGRLLVGSLERYNDRIPLITKRFLSVLSRRVPEKLKPLLD
jgi:nanoRNase/pAp phosphatase (c-di-AMP/oligoRNAs hydrolase)